MVVGSGRIAVILKGYPRLSETFIAQELLGLESRGVELEIWSLRRPTDRIRHPVHDAIRAKVRHLPEYLYREPLRVLAGLWSASRKPGFRLAWAAFLKDLRRDPTPNRIRRFGQAAVLARELQEEARHLHVHFLHTPGSVARYCALLIARPWSFSAHAKDIWTTPDWDLRGKLAEASWGVTCTSEGARRLKDLAPEPARVTLLYHGLDLAALPAPPLRRPPRDGSDPQDPVRIVSVGRAVAKKGFDDLLTALASLPADLHWRFAHVGGGAERPKLEALASRMGLSAKVAFLGARTRPDVLALMGEADLFVLPAKQAADGDRDGLPNVLLEAASQELAIVSTGFAAIPEFIRPGVEGELVAPGDWEALANSVNLLARDPARRVQLGRAARSRLGREFSAAPGLDVLAARLRPALAGAARSQTLTAHGP